MTPGRVTPDHLTATLHRCAGPDLDAATLYGLLRLRVEVFVVEQRCPYLEVDGLDLLGGTRHYWLDDGERMIAGLRLLTDDDGARRIGRVCTDRRFRGRGHAAALIGAALAEVGEGTCHLNAQSHLAAMYARHGFAVSGPEFVEDGIPHLPMSRAARP